MSRVEEQVTEQLTDLERKLKSGSFVPDAEPEEEGPPPLDDADAPPLPEEMAPETAPEPEEVSGQWQEILERTKPEIDPIVRPFLSQISGKLRGDELVLTPLNQTIRSMVNRPEVLEQLRKKATVVLSRPVRVFLAEPGGAGENDLLQRLADTANSMDNITIKS